MPTPPFLLPGGNGDHHLGKRLCLDFIWVVNWVILADALDTSPVIR